MSDECKNIAYKVELKNIDDATEKAVRLRQLLIEAKGLAYDLASMIPFEIDCISNQELD